VGETWFPPRERAEGERRSSPRLLAGRARTGVELDHELAVEGVREAQERVDPRRASAGFQPGNGRLCRPAELGQLRLRETASAALLGNVIGDLREEPAFLRMREAPADPL
jgi:hypothetical protein